ncbi:hypothetical protein HPP92_013526 [Vanilla planifolia]|uniref:PPC domain-containing protein n=1 Tax=Vanilla planifolia TaxID=51239 RepID=A0A835UYJ9_VANPL|nr:hypothetical protein HPP92_013526 [Vanilla planifolia]
MTDYSHFPAAINKLSKPCDEDDQGAPETSCFLRRHSFGIRPQAARQTTGLEEQAEAPRGDHSRQRVRDAACGAPARRGQRRPGGASPPSARRHRVGVSILGGSGAIANAALREPGSSAARFTISGRFDILCLSGSFLPPAADKGSAAAFTISLAGERGEVIGGAVAGPVRAAGPVMVVGATFLAAEYYRLPASREDEGGMEEDGDVKVTTTAVESVVVGQAKQLMGKLSNDMVLWAAALASSRSICTLLTLHPLATNNENQ